jgi:hypothetical protein
VSLTCVQRKCNIPLISTRVARPEPCHGPSSAVLAQCVWLLSTISRLERSSCCPLLPRFDPAERPALARWRQRCRLQEPRGSLQSRVGAQVLCRQWAASQGRHLDALAPLLQDTAALTGAAAAAEGAPGARTALADAGGLLARLALTLRACRRRWRGSFGRGGRCGGGPLVTGAALCALRSNSQARAAGLRPGAFLARGIRCLVVPGRG